MFKLSDILNLVKQFILKFMSNTILASLIIAYIFMIISVIELKLYLQEILIFLKFQKDTGLPLVDETMLFSIYMRIVIITILHLVLI